MVLLQEPTERRFLISELPLYAGGRGGHSEADSRVKA